MVLTRTAWLRDPAPTPSLKRRGLNILLLSALFALPAIALLAQSTPSTAPSLTLADERAALARATKQADEARRRSEALEARAAGSAAAADRTRDQSAALAARIQQSEADLRAGQARIALIAGRQRAQGHRLAARQQPIAHLAGALQQIARRSPVLALVEPGTVSDAVHRRIILANMLPVVMARTAGLRAELARTADLRQGAEVATGQLAHIRDTLASQRLTLAGLERRQRLAARDLHESAASEHERALAMGEEARDMGDLLGRIEAAGAVREALMRLPGPQPRPASPGSHVAAVETLVGRTGRPPDYRLPVVGEVVSGFGELSAEGMRARGLTIATAPLATVIAPAAGRIAFAGPFRGYGQILIVEHGEGWISLLANLADISARVGDDVRQGDPLATLGPGRPQILVELRQDETPVDIAALLR